jgi:hypothetical protein
MNKIIRFFMAVAALFSVSSCAQVEIKTMSDPHPIGEKFTDEAFVKGLELTFAKLEGNTAVISLSLTEGFATDESMKGDIDPNGAFDSYTLTDGTTTSEAKSIDKEGTMYDLPRLKANVAYAITLTSTSPLSYSKLSATFARVLITDGALFNLRLLFE